MQGIDVSTLQGNIRWSEVRTDFAMIKATQGRGEGALTKHLRVFTDPRFGSNLSGANSAGIDCGVYHYFTAQNLVEADDEAAYFLRVISPNRAKIRLWAAVDVESKYLTGIEREELTESVRRFIERVREAGFEPMLYTNPDFLVHRFESNAFNDVDIWLAQWNVSEPRAVSRLKIWQYGTEKIDGISAEVDANIGYFELPERRISVGDRYLIKPGDVYSNGRAVPARLIGREFTVKLVRDKRILLDEINSWVKV